MASWRLVLVLAVLSLGPVPTGCADSSVSAGEPMQPPPLMVSPPPASASLSAARASPAAAGAVLFQDSFDSAQQTRDLLRQDRSRWTNMQSTFEENRVALTAPETGSGERAVRMTARPSSFFSVSKADLEKEGLDLRPGDHILIEALFYIPSGTSLEDVFLLDLECMTCGYDQHPGMRITLKRSAGFPALERGKLGFRSSWQQFEVAVPRDRWFRLGLEAELGTGGEGRTRILVDDAVVLDKRGTNLPDPALFRAEYGVRLTDQKYDKVQVGLTANASPNPVTLFVDDVRITRR